MLVAVVPLRGNTATVLDLKSGEPCLIVNTGMKVHALRATGSTIVVVGEGEIAAWNLPVKDHVLGRVDINDSSWRTVFDYSTLPLFINEPHISISPDINHIAVVAPLNGLSIYDMTTGKCLVDAPSQGYRPWFTPDGCEVQCLITSDIIEGWRIVNQTSPG